jgi:predicted RNA-binding protein with PUA-like domain
VRIAKAGLPDPSDDSGTWAAVEIEPVKKFARPVTLAEIKAVPTLEDIELLRQSRLSVAEIRPDEWKKICSMAGG